MTELTSQQILELAPDSASAKAGEGLARPAKWPTLGADADAVWGECQGSGKDPYRTQVALDGPSFRCSCPSRKFPCKHGIGLMLIYTRERTAFTEAAQPAWVSEWLAGRSQRAEAKQAKAEQPVDPAAQQKRQAQRQGRIERGLKEFRPWLDDLVRTGLAQARNQSYSYWDGAAARLVDAQAPGLAAQVRALPDQLSRPDWQSALLAALGRLHLLLEAHERLDGLPEPLQHDVRHLIGWPVDLQALAGEAGETGPWLMLGSRVERQDQLRERRSWLLAPDGRVALQLDFVPMSQALAPAWPAGHHLDAELVFIPSAEPLRAVVKQAAAGAAFAPPRHDALSLYADFAARRAGLPWLRRRAYLIEAALVERDGAWWLRDGADRLLALAPPYRDAPWALLARSGGRATLLAGEWDGEAFLPIAGQDEDGWFAVSSEEET